MLTWCSSRALHIASYFACGTKQGHHKVCRARRGGPMTLPRTTRTNLNCVFVENTLVFLDPKIGGPGPPWAKAQCDGEVGLFKGYTRLHGNILYYPASKYVMHGGSVHLGELFPWGSHR